MEDKVINILPPWEVILENYANNKYLYLDEVRTLLSFMEWLKIHYPLEIKKAPVETKGP